MKQLHLLIPDMFPPQEIAKEVCAGLRLPALERILARGRVSTGPAETLEGWLCAAFGARSAAPVCAAADGVDVSDGYWLCADPVRLQLQGAQMVVLPDVVPEPDEAAELCAKLNEHFDGAGLHFVAPHPQRWYVKVETEPQLTTSPLQQVAWCDGMFHQPRGSDALRWQRIVTEVQMLLYAHPLIQGREARGESFINSLWFWGGGRAAQLSRAFDAVGGDSGLANAFAKIAGSPQFETLQAMLEVKHDKGLWVCDVPREALQRGDLYGWREAVKMVEQELAAPLMKMLQTGQLQRLTLEALLENGSQRYTFTRGDVWRLWRALRPLARYAV